MRISFHTNLDEAQSWLQYLSAWDNDVIPPTGSEIVIKHPAYDCPLTLRVCGYRFVVDVRDSDVYPRSEGTTTRCVCGYRFVVDVRDSDVYPRSEGTTTWCEVELNIPRFLQSIAEWDAWYRRHFR